MDDFMNEYSQRLATKEKETTLNLYRMGESEFLVAALVKHELGKKAEGKQLRNIDFLKLSEDRDQDLIKKAIIDEAKNQLASSQRFVKWTVIPTLFLDFYEH